MLLFDNMAVNLNGKMMIDYSVHKVSFLNFIAPNSFWKFKTFLLKVNFHVRSWVMSKTQREWMTPAAAPLQRSYGVGAVSPKYQFLKIGDGYVIVARWNAVFALKIQIQWTLRNKFQISCYFFLVYKKTEIPILFWNESVSSNVLLMILLNWTLIC